ncbi:Beta-1,4-mannosyl-glycoprotein beta-1,4-N-acetylglucosaminyltransferase [Balamuthia mandrillaris]
MGSEDGYKGKPQVSWSVWAKQNKRALLSVGGVVFLVFLILVHRKFFPTELVITDFGSCEANGWATRKPGTVPRVFDAFTLNSEMQMLELRLHELSPYVDFFVIVESKLTFSGKTKPLYFEENMDKFSAFKDKIIRVILDEEEHRKATQMGGPEGKKYQKNAIMLGLRPFAKPDDLVIFSDLDELPNPDIVYLLKHCQGYDLPVTFHTPGFIYDFGCREDKNNWRRAKLVKFSQLTEQCGSFLGKHLFPSSVCPDDLRDDMSLSLGLRSWSPLYIYNAGWHMSYFMSIEKIQEKIGSISHTERDTPANKNPEYLTCLKANCVHVNWHDRGHRVEDPFTQRRTPAYAKEMATKGVPEFRAWFPQAKDIPCKMDWEAYHEEHVRKGDIPART